MAAPMLKSLGSRRLLRLCRFSDIYRTYLKEGYSQDEIWKQRLQSKYLQKLDAKAFGIELLENFEKTTTFHVVDIDLFVNKIQDLPPSFGYLANEVLYRFRHCQSSVPIKENIMHAIVRGFLESGDLDRLVEIIKDKSKYGVFPDALSMTMLIDHFLKQKNYEVAAQLAYEVMLGEEYKNQTRNFLSLCAALKYYIHTFNHERPEPVPVDEEEEVVYKPVKVIRNLYYDDHFDIKDDRFLLGKTFYLISKNTPRLEGTFSRSLQLLGLGLYDKFELGNKLLEQWIKDDSLEKVVYQSALLDYMKCLKTAPTRDPDAEPKTMGLKTMDDEIELLKLTPEEKKACLSKFKVLENSLTEERRHQGKLEVTMEDYMKSNYFHNLNDLDSYALSRKYTRWAGRRDGEVEKYLGEKQKVQVEEGIQTKLDALHEREQLLTYFDNVNEIKWKMQNFREKVQKTVEEEEYVEAPGERNVKVAIKKRK